MKTEKIRLLIRKLIIESSFFHDQEIIDKILDKINDVGYENIDSSDKAILNNFSNDDEHIKEILKKMHDLTEKFKILNQKIENEKNNKVKDIFFDEWTMMHKQMSKYENELRYVYKIEDPYLLKNFEDKKM
jgi:hypothetical protein